MKNEPVVKEIRAARKAYAETPKGKLEALINQERRWKRRLTIASGKLAEVREDINALAMQMAEPEKTT